jgi:hypothetical protein
MSQAKRTTCAPKTTPDAASSVWYRSTSSKRGTTRIGAAPRRSAAR